MNRGNYIWDAKMFVSLLKSVFRLPHSSYYAHAGISIHNWQSREWIKNSFKMLWKEMEPMFSSVAVAWHVQCLCLILAQKTLRGHALLTIRFSLTLGGRRGESSHKTTHLITLRNCFSSASLKKWIGRQAWLPSVGWDGQSCFFPNMLCPQCDAVCKYSRTS